MPSREHQEHELLVFPVGEGLGVLQSSSLIHRSGNQPREGQG